VTRSGRVSIFSRLITHFVRLTAVARRRRR
jgi:hypothetical protein